MKLYQRACLVMAHEGVRGLARRAARKWLRPPSPPVRVGPPPEELAAAQREYARQVDAFTARIRQLGREDLAHYYWYHTVDLGDGLVTPGEYDYRGVLPAFRFPDDLRGRSVLDVGSATGFFAFEFERRGADVVAVDLPSLADWDMVSAERDAVLEELRVWHHAADLEETWHRHIDGPFRFCQEMLRSRVRRCYSTVYDLTPAKLGTDGFDLVYLGDVTPHLFNPLRALDVVATLCNGTLIFSADLAESSDPRPLLRYTGGDSRRVDSRSWWRPNRECLEQILRRVGFRRVELVGRHRSILRRHWLTIDRPIFHATR